ncbi:MAG: hypothetical protein KKB25_01595 [Nanoarchaeota archaeon]|nr:hypothetical protein [Nanoarchaeota archaeon]
MGDPLIRSPKNITDINECAFKIGVEDNPEKSIQKILDSKSSGYRSKEDTVNSVRPVFEDLNAMKAYRDGIILLTLERGDVDSNFRNKYCYKCNLQKGCDVPDKIERNTRKTTFERPGLMYACEE